MFWDNFYYKILDRWSPPVGKFPRWFTANSYPTLADSITTPSLFSITRTATSTFILPSSIGLFPAAWIPPISSNVTGNTIQSLFDVLEHEKQALKLASKTLWSVKSFFPDKAENQFAWFLTVKEPIHTLELLLDNGNKLEISPATSEIDLFYSHTPTWKQVGNEVLITNLGIINNTAHNLNGDGWLFIDNMNLWNSNDVLFIQHPNTNQWIPLHPDDIREDGLLPFYYETSNPINLRSRYVAAATALTTVLVHVNGQSASANLVDMRTSIDTTALLFQLKKNSYESNADFLDSLLLASWFSGQTKKNICSFLSTYFRTYSYANLSANSTGISIPSYTTSYELSIPKRQYVEELQVPQLTGGTYEFISRVYDPEYWCAFLDNRETLLIPVSGSPNTYKFDSYVPFYNHNNLVQWKTTSWIETSNNIQFTDNWNNNSSTSVDVLFSKHVLVSDPTITSQKISFEKRSPYLRWQSQTIIVDETYGNAQFA